MDNRYTAIQYNAFTIWQKMAANTRKKTAAYVFNMTVFCKKWFGFVNTVHEKDRFHNVRFRSTYSVGSGYQFFEGDKRNLSLEGGVSFIRQDYL